MLVKLWYNLYNQMKGGMLMGCWGMGMAQSDEFCEIYDKFMDSYTFDFYPTNNQNGVLL